MSPDQILCLRNRSVECLTKDRSELRSIETSSTQARKINRLELDLWVCQANIDRYRSMLAQGPDDGERQRLTKLLGREENSRLEFERASQIRWHLLQLAEAGDPAVAAIFDGLLDDAIEVMAAAMGHIQLIDPRSANLIVIASRGLSEPFLAFFAEQHGNVSSFCPVPLASPDCAMVEDIRCHAPYIGEHSGEMMAQAQSVAVLTAPLRLCGMEQMVGTISAHWKAPTRGKPESQRRLALRIDRAMNDLATLRA